MARVILLGTAAAVSSPDHAHTSLLVEGDEGAFLVDCGDNTLPRMIQAGVSHDALQGVFLTHFHPDHVAGVPSLIVDLWLLGRQDPFKIYGPRDVLDRLWAMMDLYRWECWEGLFQLVQVEIPLQAGTTAMNEMGIVVTAAPVEHLIPSLGLRFEVLASGRSFAYSGDSAPCQEMIDLAQGVDLLLHEATGAAMGHSSPAQAGEVARKAGVGRLVLIHYPPLPDIAQRWVDEARASFGGPVEMGQDYQSFDL